MTYVPYSNAAPRMGIDSPSIEEDVKRHFSLRRCVLASGVDPRIRQSVARGESPPRRFSFGSFVFARWTFSSLCDRQARECSGSRPGPSFHQGLYGPSLRSVLWRRITYPRGLRPCRTGPGESRMLTSDLVSPRPVALTTPRCESNDQRAAGATVACFSLPGSYSSSSFHIRRTIAAIRRAIVSLARLGFVPADVSCT